MITESTRSLYHKATEMSRIHIRGFCNVEQHLTYQNLRCCSQRKDLVKKVGFIFEKGLDFLSLLWHVVVLTGGTIEHKQITKQIFE